MAAFLPSLSQSRQISQSFKVFVSNLCNCTLLEILQADYCGLQTYKHSHIQQYATLFGFMYNKLLSKHYIVRRCCIATLLLLPLPPVALSFDFPNSRQPSVAAASLLCCCTSLHTIVILWFLWGLSHMLARLQLPVATFPFAPLNIFLIRYFFFPLLLPHAYSNVIKFLWTFRHHTICHCVFA